MARPRVFVSSTYYDLKHIRNSLESFIDNLGYESVLFERGDIPFRHDAPLDISCYEQINTCHIFVLIIGGRYGSAASDRNENSNAGPEEYNSITRIEYETARDRDIPVYIFIEKNVHSEYHTYKINRNNPDIQYAHADSINIFKLIDDIYRQTRNNLIRDFEKFEDLSMWLRDQWAGVFAELLSKKKKDQDQEELSVQISVLKELSSVLKGYSESIMAKIRPEDFEQLILASNKSLKSNNLNIFKNNPFIKFLMKKYDGDLDAATFFDAFEKSNSVRELLQHSGFDPEFAERIGANKQATIDFDFLKRELFE